MAIVKITNVSELNTSTLELKSKVENSLATNIKTFKETLSGVENYKNNGLEVNVGDWASTLRNNADSILNNITKSEKNIYDYLNCLNELNVDDYNEEEKPINLDELYKEFGKEGGKKNNSSGGGASGSGNKGNSNGNGNKNNNSKDKDNDNDKDEGNKDSGSKTLEDYLNTIPGRIIPGTSLIAKTESINLDSNSGTFNPNTLTMFSEVTYNEEGFAMFHERYVISTSADYGMVGDLIDIQKSDGNVLKCIIGNVSPDSEENVINFCIDQSSFKDDINVLHPNWLDTVSSIKNKGNYFDIIRNNKF